MRTITKTEPPALAVWKAQTPGASGIGQGSYEQMPADVAAAVREALYREQCGLDAYTGEQIRLGTHVEPNGRRDGDTFHLEHMWPQEHSLANGREAETVDFSNMAGCRPGSPPAIQKLPHGARYKDDQHWPALHERHEFVRPTMPGAEARFRYDATGKMHAVDPTDTPAVRTIEKINLNVEPLKGNRASAYLAATNKSALSVRDAERLLRSIELKEAACERLRPFSFVQKQALREHIAAGTTQATP